MIIITANDSMGISYFAHFVQPKLLKLFRLFFATIVDLPVHILRQSALLASRLRVAGFYFAATMR